MEAAGVELSGVLTARKLLIIGTATPAKRPHCTDRLYVYSTKMACGIGEWGGWVFSLDPDRRIDRILCLSGLSAST